MATGTTFAREYVRIEQAANDLNEAAKALEQLGESPDRLRLIKAAAVLANDAKEAVA